MIFSDRVSTRRGQLRVGRPKWTSRSSNPVFNELGCGRGAGFWSQKLAAKQSAGSDKRLGRAARREVSGSGAVAKARPFRSGIVGPVPTGRTILCQQLPTRPVGTGPTRSLRSARIPKRRRTAVDGPQGGTGFSQPVSRSDMRTDCAHPTASCGCAALVASNQCHPREHFRQR